MHYPSTHYYKGDGTNQVPIASTEGYNNTDKEGDWWNPTIKTIYDPCPNGYRIPKHGTYGLGVGITTHPDWSAWTGSRLTAGRTFKNTSFFPTSGYRNRSSGQFSLVGSESFSWMSSPYTPASGINMQFYSGAVYLVTSHARSASFPTRCIKE